MLLPGALGGGGLGLAIVITLGAEGVERMTGAQEAPIALEV